MTEFDVTWKDIPEAQDAALAHAMAYAKPFLKIQQRQAGRAGEWHPPITEFHVAEMMCMASSSLWYSQAKSWAEGKPPAPGADGIWTIAGKAIVRLVEIGYQGGVWWDATKAWDHPQKIAINLSCILEAVRLLRQIRGRSLAVYSQWFEALPYLMIPGLKVENAMKALSAGQVGAKVIMGQILALYDEEFAKKLKATRKDLLQHAHDTYKPTNCIKPGCDNQVAPQGIRPRGGHFKNYRGKGACCRGHASYFCLKCKKPHSYLYKIGQKHLADHFGKDWDGTDMEGNKWTA